MRELRVILNNVIKNIAMTLDNLNKIMALGAIDSRYNYFF